MLLSSWPLSDEEGISLERPILARQRADDLDADRRIPMFVLHLCAHTVHSAVTEMREAAQTFGNLSQKRIAVLHRERAGGGVE
jgi:hypothetical protein